MNRSQPTSVVPFDVKLMNITATVMFMGCLAACVMTVGWWLMRTPAFNIGRIVVEGELVHNNADAARQCGARAQRQLLYRGPEGGSACL